MKKMNILVNKIQFECVISPITLNTIQKTLNKKTPHTKKTCKLSFTNDKPKKESYTKMHYSDKHTDPFFFLSSP